MLKEFGRLYNALVFAYPNYPWLPAKFTCKKKKAVQRRVYFLAINNMNRTLFDKIREILPISAALTENYLHPSLFWGS